MRNTRNPFEYGGVVSGDKFCNRQKEKADLRKAIRNREKLFVFSERRFGKTSLIKSVLARLPKKQTVAAYVDLWPTESEAAFVTALAKAIAESMTTSAQKLLQIAKRFFGSLAPAVTVNEEGRPEIGFGVTRRAHLSAALDEVLDTPAKIAATADRDVVIVFDEFQQILEYGDDRVEKKLRSVIQNHKNVGYIFLGSRKHLIPKMFMDRARPLYRAGGHYPLGPITEADWAPFIREKFIAANKRIGDQCIHSICAQTQEHPFFTQHLCHVFSGPDLMPEMDEGGFTLDYWTPAGASLAETNRMVLRMEQITKAIPEVEGASRRTGLELGLAAVTEANRGDILVKLRKDRKRAIDDVMEDVRAKVNAEEPAVRVEFVQVLQDMIGDLTSEPEPIQIKLFSQNAALLESWAPKVAAAIRKVKGVVDVLDGIENTISGPAVNFQIDPSIAARAGFTPEEVATDAAAILGGEPAATPVINNDRAYTVRVRFPAGDRASLETMSN